jgi:hypothetical protein
MADGLVQWIAPVQARRKEFEAHPGRVWDILDAGGRKARKASRLIMKRVRKAIFNWNDAHEPDAYRSFGSSGATRSLDPPDG